MKGVANCHELLGNCHQPCQFPKLLSALLSSLFCRYHFVLPSSLHSNPPSQRQQAKRLQQTHCMLTTVAQCATRVANEWVAAENGLLFIFLFSFDVFSSQWLTISLSGYNKGQYGWSPAGSSDHIVLVKVSVMWNMFFLWRQCYTQVLTSLNSFGCLPGGI